MQGKFCPKCGKENVDLYHGFCGKCYSKMQSFTKVPEKIEIVTCKKCGRQIYESKWLEPDFELFEKQIMKKIQTTLVNPKIKIDFTETEVTLEINGFADRTEFVPVNEKYAIRIERKEKKCDYCLKKSSDYFELKIQLRKAEPFDIFKYEKVMKLIIKETHYLSNRNPEAQGFWYEENKDGFDFFYSYKRAGESIAKRVCSKYSLKYELTTTLKGIKKDGTKNIKYTYCIRV